MPSSIALGCNGYEAYMQQILTPWGLFLGALNHNFCLQKPPESNKTERKTQNYLSFLGCFRKWLAVLQEITDVEKLPLMVIGYLFIQPRWHNLAF